jgi:hypothetical protein
MSGPLFPLGHVVMTPGAAAACEASGDDLLAFLIQHICLDPGDLSAEDIAENHLSLREGFRILSAYRLCDGTRIWIITEADRSSTCILLPSEY